MEAGFEIERGNAGPGFGFIDDPKIAKIKRRIAEEGLIQPDASVMTAESDQLKTALEKTLDDLRARGVADPYGRVEDE